MVITAPSFFITYVSTAIHLIEFRAYKDNNYSLVSVLYSYIHMILHSDLLVGACGLGYNLSTLHR